jgi:hypothetical protein
MCTASLRGEGLKAWWAAQAYLDLRQRARTDVAVPLPPKLHGIVSVDKYTKAQGAAVGAHAGTLCAVADPVCGCAGQRT